MRHPATDHHPVPADWLIPRWPAIAGVRAVFTTRQGGHSQAPWDSFNLGTHVGDDAVAVARNRQQLHDCLSTLSGRAVQAHFMEQVHGWAVHALLGEGGALRGDACVTATAGQACTIMVADCLPVLIAHRQVGVVGAAHAGWRGLLGQEGYGVLEALWDAYCRLLRQHGAAIGSDASTVAAQTQVWLGPCIGPRAFEVGAEVYQAFTRQDRQAQRCFTAAAQPGKWYADLAGLARQRLHRLGLQALYGNDSSTEWCTFSNPSRFFSHRRDAAVLGSTGRMAAVIWRS